MSKYVQFRVSLNWKPPCALAVAPTRTSQVAGMRCPTPNHFSPTQNVVRPLRYISNLINLFGRGRKTEFCTIGE